MLPLLLSKQSQGRWGTRNPFIALQLSSTRSYRMQVPLIRLQCGVNSYDWGKVGTDSAAATFAAATPADDFKIQKDKPYAEVPLTINKHDNILTTFSCGWARIHPIPLRICTRNEPSSISCKTTKLSYLQKSATSSDTSYPFSSKSSQSARLSVSKPIQIRSSQNNYIRKTARITQMTTISPR